MSNGDIAVIVVCSVISPILVGGLVVWLVLWLKKRDIGSVEENVPLTDEA